LDFLLSYSRKPGDKMIELFAFLSAFMLVLFGTPSLIKVAKLKHLVDFPTSKRKVHKNSVPSIGGIAIFAATVVSLTFWYPFHQIAPENFRLFKYLLACLVFLFFVGIKDDIIGVSPGKKLFAQLIVVSLMVLFGGARISTMGGLFGVEELGYEVSIVFSIFTFMVIINGFNLIDGVDGLAAGVGFFASVFAGFWFHTNGELLLEFLSWSVAGSALGFLVFNFPPARLFMGDSGSLTLGLVCSILVYGVLETEPTLLESYSATVPRPLIALALLVYPMLDVLRVFIIRVASGGKPWVAGKDHIHHRLLAKGWSHLQTSLIVYSFMFLVMGFVLYFSYLDVTVLFFLSLAVSVLYLMLFLFKK